MKIIRSTKLKLSAIIILDINIKYLASVKIGPRKIIKISPSATTNPPKIWQSFNLQK